MGEERRQPYSKVMVLRLLILGLSVVFGEPDVFNEYSDDSLREVDISQSVAINSCLSGGQTLKAKIDAASDQCFGLDYSIGDLAGNNGVDSDNDGFPDSYNRNEGCFYRAMGWVNAADGVDAAAIKADFGGLSAALKTEFDANIGECAAWSGDFSNRRKREVGEILPAVMREANLRRGRRQEKKKSKGPAGRKIGGKKGGSRAGNKKGPVGRKSGPPGRKGGKRGNESVPKKGPKGPKGPTKNEEEPYLELGINRNDPYRPPKKKNSGRALGGSANNKLDENVYNIMWCFDLAVEQILEKCVEQKLQA